MKFMVFMAGHLFNFHMIVKKSINDALKSSGLQSNIVGAILGIASTLLNHSNTETKEIKPAKRILVSLIKSLISGVSAQNPNAVKNIGNSIIEAFFNNKNKNNTDGN